MSLSSNIVRMNLTRKFDEFDEVAIFEDTREDQSGSCNLVAILIIHFVAMAVTFRDLGSTIDACDN
jgi:hypothetical protein